MATVMDQGKPNSNHSVSIQINADQNSSFRIRFGGAKIWFLVSTSTSDMRLSFARADLAMPTFLLQLGQELERSN